MIHDPVTDPVHFREMILRWDIEYYESYQYSIDNGEIAYAPDDDPAQDCAANLAHLDSLRKERTLLMQQHAELFI